jgi:hypothetical protein
VKVPASACSGAKAGDRRVVGDLVGRNYPEGDILAAAPLDTAARALPDRIGIEQQRNHHLRVERRPPPAIPAIGGVKSTQIDLVDRIQHEAGEVIVGQPVAQTGRQQELLLTVAVDEILRHRRPPQSRTTSCS